MKRESLTTKTRPELELMLSELRAQLAQLRFDLADRKLKRTSEVGKVRVTIARVLTRLAEAPAKRAALDN